jgi:general secretion pathway protein F
MTALQFHYKAYDRDGRTAKGMIAAVTEQEALAKLKEMGLLPASLSAGERPRIFELALSLRRDSNFTIAQKIDYVSYLHSLLRAGLPLDRSHLLIAEGGGNRFIATQSRRIADELASGKSLSQSWEVLGKSFTPMEVGMIASAEKTGNFLVVLDQLRIILKQRKDLKDKVISASVYPIFLVLMSVAALVVIATVLVPALVPLFGDDATQLPFLIRAVLFIKQIFNEYLPLLLLALLSMIIGFRFMSRDRRISRLRARYLLKIPMVRMLNSAQAARQLNIALESGLTLQNGLRLVAQSFDNAIVRDELVAAGDAIANGASLSKALTGSSLFDRPAVEMVKLAEASGSLAGAFAHIAEHDEGKARGQIEKLMTLMTPVLTLAMGLLIGGLIVSVMQSVLSINDLTFR